MNIAKIFFVALATASLGGCGASLPKLTTGSLFGGAKPAVAAVDRNNDPLTRTMDVAATSARAIKCGYNFDPTKLKNQFLATQTAADPASAEKLTQIYDTTFNGVSKAITDKGSDYCSAEKTARIKLALNRHLAGDFTPSPPEPSEPDGIFGGWGSGSTSSEGVNSKAVFEN
ncbi:MAG TPA: hypothetical protein VIF13_04660 [Hyphomicrobium sp.]|jgi:hypothetical protein